MPEIHWVFTCPYDDCQLEGKFFAAQDTAFRKGEVVGAETKCPHCKKPIVIHGTFNGDGQEPSFLRVEVKHKEEKA